MIYLYGTILVDRGGLKIGYGMKVASYRSFIGFIKRTISHGPTVGSVFLEIFWKSFIKILVDFNDKNGQKCITTNY